jgi:hypothetical protein
MTDIDNPHEYVAENRETLVRIVRHGDDQFVRALALAALVEFGDDPDPETIIAEIETLQREGLA